MVFLNWIIISGWLFRLTQQKEALGPVTSQQKKKKEMLHYWNSQCVAGGTASLACLKALKIPDSVQENGQQGNERKN